MGGRGIVLVGDYAIDTNEDTVDLGDKETEAAADGGAATKGFDVGDVVEDEEEDGVREAVEVVDGLRGDGGR